MMRQCRLAGVECPSRDEGENNLRLHENASAVMNASRSRHRADATAFGYQNAAWQFSHVVSIGAPASNSASASLLSMAARAGFIESWNARTYEFHASGFS